METQTTSPEQNKLVSAFTTAVKNYKPWHQTHWNSNNRDALFQIVDGAEKLGFLDEGQAQEICGLSPREYQGVKEKTYVPDRKVRKKIWTHLKNELGLRK